MKVRLWNIPKSLQDFTPRKLWSLNGGQVEYCSLFCYQTRWCYCCTITQTLQDKLLQKSPSWPWKFSLAFLILQTLPQQILIFSDICTFLLGEKRWRIKCTSAFRGFINSRPPGFLKNVIDALTSLWQKSIEADGTFYLHRHFKIMKNYKSNT